MAAISAVFTIGDVANLLGEDENWIFDLSINMFPEDGCLWVHGVGEDGVPAFTRDGIENLRQITADERAAGRGPPATPLSKLPCGVYRMLTFGERASQRGRAVFDLQNAHDGAGMDPPELERSCQAQQVFPVPLDELDIDAMAEAVEYAIVGGSVDAPEAGVAD